MRCFRKKSLSLAGGIVSFLLFVQPAAGQIKKRVIPLPEWAPTSGEEEVQLELVEIKVGGRPVILGQSFDADENWLKDLTLRVRNVGNQPILAFGVGGGLLRGVDEELLLQASFKYGIAWNWGKGFDTENATPGGLVFKPGETVELSYANVEQITRKVLAEEGEGAFCKLKFMAPGIQYADGTVDSVPRMRFYGGGNL